MRIHSGGVTGRRSTVDGEEAASIPAPSTTLLPVAARISAVRRPSGAVDPIRPDEHGGPAFFGHDPVVLVPVVMLAAGSAEDLSPELP